MPNKHSSNEINNFLEHHYRLHYGKLFSTVFKLFGVKHLKLAEEVIDKTFERARYEMETKSLPKQPADWLWQIARFKSIELLRRENKLYDKSFELNQIDDDENKKLIKLDDKMTNDNLVRMMFICSMPSLSIDLQYALILKFISGFRIKEIAKALCVNQTTITQRLAKGKQKLSEHGLNFESLKGRKLSKRLDLLNKLLYQIFIKGCDSLRSDDTMAKELCYEAVRLTELLTINPKTQTPQTHALLAFMLFNASRIPAMFDDNGNPLQLNEQERSFWNRDMIKKGFVHLHRSADSKEVTEYHLEAGISACHSLARSYETTDWEKIMNLYDNYLKLNNSPFIALNRAIALTKSKGTEEGIEALRKLKNSRKLKKHHLFYSTMGNLYLKQNDYDSALKNYEKALNYADNEIDENFYSKKIEICQQRVSMTVRYRLLNSF